MDDSLLKFAVCGAAGAMTYSFPVYLKAISKQPPLSYAKTSFAFAVFVGGICAALFTRMIGFHWEWTVEPEPWPLAMVIGLSANPLVPVLLRKLESWVAAFEGIKK